MKQDLQTIREALEFYRKYFGRPELAENALKALDNLQERLDSEERDPLTIILDKLNRI